ncbi:MIF4-like, type 1/2/3 domain-containing protein [Rozella allomycis CSF55]|uniref:Translation initiation factor eIF2B subunit epsilon n=1 Tax=Rozella allomycis (strain CSF55) TaxID=988480 RepID=A0A075B4E6_ROZAC|nr:MIF4-like, type 1/2/3 domain-containing protein [Rozella allomycis CSF55]|eukprot:EPZ36295.1 MIF4-like, type 1/2/3 domain-containing protein [Rozella allomycis CSF55]
MAPKKGNKEAAQVADNNEIRQAVVIADTFDTMFMPLTLHRPRCLMPLCNVPIIEYTLEALSSAGIQEIFIYCRSHIEMIKSYLQSSKWSQQNAIKIDILISNRLRSVGDALRDLDSRGLIIADKNPFLLVHGDLVTNLQLGKIFDEESAKMKKDPNCIMTMITIPALSTHPLRSFNDSAVFGYDSKSNHLIFYEPIKMNTKRITFNGESLAKHPSCRVRFDLLDCQIDICSNEVLALLTENFDYGDIRKDFVRGVLHSEILGHSIAIHIAEEGYATRVRSSRLYDSISRDLIQRWAFPVVPDLNLFGKTSYSFKRPFVYLENDIFLARTSVVQRGSMIGSGTRLGEETVIKESVLGRNCMIDRNCSLNSSYLLENIQVGKFCSIESSIIGSNVIIKDNVTISRGCLIGDNVILGAGVTLAPFTKISSIPIKDLNEEFVSMKITDHFDENSFDQEIVGLDGKGFSWEKDSSIKEDSEAGSIEDEEVNFNSIGFESTKKVEESDSETEDEFYDDDDDFEEDVIKSFKNKIQDLIKIAIENGHDPQHVAVELQACKLATDAKQNQLLTSFYDCLDAIIFTLVQLIDVNPQPSALSSSVKSIFSKWAPLIIRFTASASDSHSLIDIIMKHFNDRKLIKSFWIAIYTLYENDALNENIVLEWYNDDKWSHVDASAVAARNELSKFVDWLENASEEESEDDDDDDDE